MKYGPTAANAAPHWYVFLYWNDEGAEILDDRVILHLTDGGWGDADGTVNGEISDPGAVSVASDRRVCRRRAPE